ncbi:MAG: hypothetical protein ACI8RD_014572, partial [Bacillariaceae sp.]
LRKVEEGSYYKLQITKKISHICDVIIVFLIEEVS